MDTQTSHVTSGAPANGERIVSTPGTCGGKPRIAGTRIRVQDIYFWHEVEGQTADEIVSSFPQLSMADVYAALSYFWANREAMLAEIERQRVQYEELKKTQPSLVAEKLKGIGLANAADDSVPS
jgi:uncharacterized protein (DUF433 family)